MYLPGTVMANEVKSEPRGVTGTTEPRPYQRRERRYPLPIPIEVSGIDKGGRPFCEQTVTSDVSQRGCRFSLSKELERDSIVALRVLRTLAGSPGEPRLVMFQIIYSRAEQGAWTMGAWTLQPEIAWCPDIPREAES